MARADMHDPDSRHMLSRQAPHSSPDSGHDSSSGEFTALYFNRGTTCYIRLLVSIFSLRKHYMGPVTLMQEGPLDRDIAHLLQELDVTVKPIRETDEKVLVRKATLWREMPARYAMYLDSDTIVMGPIEEFRAWIKEWGFVATWFNGWSTTGSRVRKRIEEWRSVVPELVDDALLYGKAINSGIQGWSRAHPLLEQYESLTRRGSLTGCNRLVLDEIALQLVLPLYRHYLADPIWNTSGVYGEVEKARILHYHGRKHCRRDSPNCDIWKDHYFELLSCYPNYSESLRRHWKDKRLNSFLESLKARRNDLTVVTAVDPVYAKKFQTNILAWMKTPGLREQQFLVFVNGFRCPEEHGFLDYPNVRVVHWDYPFPEATRRESMLASFVLGAAKHVKTKYWMKLDADCYPKRWWWECPDYNNYTIVSHRWGYTRMKGDKSTRHWFNTLDDVFSPNLPYFERIFDPVEDSKVSHRVGNPNNLAHRFASFCHIERTAFTQRIAEHIQLKCSGRMPIPSQDTLSWYCSQIWQAPVKLLNMRKWFKP